MTMPSDGHSVFYCEVNHRHGLPALPVQGEQQVRHQADQLQLLYLRDPAYVGGNNLWQNKGQVETP